MFVEHLEVQRQRLGFDVFAFVVMPEHVHLIVLPDGGVIHSGGRVDLFGRLVRVGELYRPELGGSRGEFVGHEDCARRGM